ncbi:hypothetical protein PQC12_gp205 [Synechococcus phage S-SCSM1]|uniref:Uncharacterized protein n=1 Tax=Synechococcus phage S-SCSM1 TaxID=2588487 RepID=A0A6M2ZHN6_9CAUD|nr:hypothetical protein PQC12_gp205 [Synechococcus phage S-SCSM1]QFG06430.2 hypothetical protein SSCSM1_167 [Synechococcus phage S-SCSM1]
MKKFLPLMMLLMTAGAANAGGLVTKHASSVQLTVDAARSTATRIGHGMSISGSGVTTTDGTTTGVVGNSVLMTSDGFTGSASVVTASQATDGDAFSFSASYTQGDAVPTSAPTVGAVPNFGSVTSYASGTAGSLAGTLDNAHTMTLTAGGAGSSATGQFITEITVID